MKPIQTIQLGQHAVEVKGKTFEVTVVAYVYHDSDFQVDWEMPLGEKEQLISDLECGKCEPCGIVVRASYSIPGGETVTGEDSCWGFFIYRPSDVTDAIKDHDFVSTALESFKAELLTAVARAKQTASVLS